MHIRAVMLVLALFAAHLLWRSLTSDADASPVQATAPSKLVGLRGASAHGGEDISETASDALSSKDADRAAWIAPAERSRRRPEP